MKPIKGVLYKETIEIYGTLEKDELMVVIQRYKNNATSYQQEISSLETEVDVLKEHIEELEE